MAKFRILTALLALMEFSVAFAAAQVAQDQIRSALGSDQLRSLIQDINTLPAEARRASAMEIIRFAAVEFASGSEYNGKSILRILPEIADDDLLAHALGPYLINKDSEIRQVANEALSRGTGAAVATLLSDTIKVQFANLPKVPYRFGTEDEERAINENGANFAYSLKGLLRSEIPESRTEGKRYLELLRTRYSTSPEGLEIIRRFGAELEKSGIDTDNLTSPPLRRSEVDSVTHASPVTGVRDTASSKAATTTAKVEKTELQSLLWIAGSLIALTLCIYMVKRLRGV